VSNLLVKKMLSSTIGVSELQNSFYESNALQSCGNKMIVFNRYENEETPILEMTA
jgi:hypothetical protein